MICERVKHCVTISTVSESVFSVVIAASMTLTGQVSLLLLLLSEAVVLVASVPQRSARWDAFLQHSCQRRSANTWQGGGWSATCTLEDLTADDRLGRRTSGLLSPPQNQGCCGSCWAFAAAHTYTDHLSIAAGNRTSQISSQLPTACVMTNGCCAAEDLFEGFKYFKEMGATTDACVPYELHEYLYI